MKNFVSGAQLVSTFLGAAALIFGGGVIAVVFGVYLLIGGAH